ncbi:MAG: hypothetical protein ACTSQJ_00900 [Promethearchaeota archaeon]
MTITTEKNFLNRLYEVVYKLSTIAKTQSYRFQKIWNNYFRDIKIKPHIVRNIPLEKEKFLNDINYRIEILKILTDSLVDGFYSIKSILQALYEHYFLDSEAFKKDFSEKDQLILKYLAAREILGNLVQYNKMDHETVPLKYNIIARDYLMIKLKGMTLEDISESLKKLNKVVEKNTLIGIMEDIKKDGIINIDKKDKSYKYTLKEELKLSDVGAKKYNEILRPLIDWPTQFWRSYYNIRELNLTPSESVKYANFLKKILSKSATQGFGPTYYVFQNLAKYYEKIKEE